jgi:tetratricopeptide (TPR) repeat protein
MYEDVMGAIIETSSRDLWVHSAYQISSENRHGVVTEEAADHCRSVLDYQPENSVALYYLAQFHREQGNYELAEISYLQLLHAWPHFGDGYLEFGKCLTEMGKVAEARTAFRHAERLGLAEGIELGADLCREHPEGTPDHSPGSS